MIPPPLPQGWTEHIGESPVFFFDPLTDVSSAPGGQPYYYDAATRESTYVRPVAAYLPSPFQPDAIPAQLSLRTQKKKQKKESYSTEEKTQKPI